MCYVILRLVGFHLGYTLCIIDALHSCINLLILPFRFPTGPLSGGVGALDCSTSDARLLNCTISTRFVCSPHAAIVCSNERTYNEACHKYSVKIAKPV